MSRLAVLILLALPLSAHGSEIIIQAAGDVMLGGRWEQQMSQDGYFYPFQRIAPELQKGDITLVNLEAPLTDRGTEFTDKKYRFRVKPSAVVALKKAGITTVTLANNHSMDYGAVGLLDTLQQLDRAGIGHVGGGENLAAARKPAIYDIRGVKVAVLGYSLTLPQEFWAGEKRAGTAPLLEKMVKNDIVAARKQVSIVIVTVHWGEEGTTRLRDYQPRLARMMIDAGADVIIGHHPHVLQGIERYKRGIVFYSLGNVAFASKSRVVDRTLLVRLRFDGVKQTAELLPVTIQHKEVGFQATPLSTRRADDLIERVTKLPPATLVVRKEDERWLVDF